MGNKHSKAKPAIVLTGKDGKFYVEHGGVKTGHDTRDEANGVRDRLNGVKQEQKSA